MNNIIQIGLTASVEINYIKLLINSLKLLANKPNNLEFIIGVDVGKGKGKIDLSDLKEYKIIKYNTQLPYSSKAHGLLMDHLLHKHFNKVYGMLIDSDVCFLKKGWDDDFKNEIIKKDLYCIATENVNNDRKFPGPYCMFFLTKYMQKINYSTLPVQSIYFEKKYNFGKEFEIKLNENYKNNLNGTLFKISKNADIYGLKNGDSMVFDTNSQFNIFFKNMKNKYKILNRKRPFDKDLVFLHKEGKGQEFYLNGKVYLTHQGRCRNIWGKSKRNILWLRQIKDWFSKDELNILFFNISNNILD